MAYYVVFDDAGNPRLFDRDAGKPVLPVFTLPQKARNTVAILDRNKQPPIPEDRYKVVTLDREMVENAARGGVEFYVVDPEVPQVRKDGKPLRELMAMYPRGG